MLPCLLVDLALHFTKIRSWFPAGIQEVEDLAGFPDVFDRAPDVHCLVAAEGSFKGLFSCCRKQRALFVYVIWLLGGNLC